MARCGCGCGWGAPSAWTKDCLDHDICIVDQNGQNGLATDKNCGDEFRHAADDYTFGVLRGCRGQISVYCCRRRAQKAEVVHGVSVSMVEESQ